MPVVVARNLGVAALLWAVACHPTSEGPDDGGGVDADEGADAETGPSVDGALDSSPEADLDEGPPPPCATSDLACTSERCHPPPFAPSCMAGRVVDRARVPLAGQPTVVCAAGSCYWGRTDGDGWFAVALPDPLVEEMALSFPGTRPLHAPFCRLTELCDGAVASCEPYRLLPAPTEGLALPPGTLSAPRRVEAEDGGAVILPAGAEVLVPIDREPWIALSRYPLDEDLPCFVDPGAPPLALYAITPSDTFVAEPGSRARPVLIPAQLDLPNESGLPPGAEVRIRVLGGLLASDVDAAEGQWSEGVRGEVSDGGDRIRTDGSEGVGYLTWIGVYAE